MADEWSVLAILVGVLGSAVACICTSAVLLNPSLMGWAMRMTTKALRSRGGAAVICFCTCLLIHSVWHAPLDRFFFDSGADPDGAIETALRRQRPLLVFRNRILESAGFAVESIDLIAALEDHFYIAVHNDGHYDPAVQRARPPELRRRLDELLLRDRLDYTQSAAHTQIHLGAAGDFSCDSPASTYCIGRTTFETDRVPRAWVPKINTQHQVWVPSPFNVRTFSQAGVYSEKLRFVPSCLLCIFMPAIDRSLYDCRYTRWWSK